MPHVTVDGIDIYHETFGRRQDPTVLMVNGLGAQCLNFDDELCEMVAAAGHHVVRFDNRDVGLSTHLDGVDADPFAALVAASAGDPIDAPYTLDDMARDAVGLLDQLEVDRAHVFGTSMGGMIAQALAIGHPDRVASLTSVMSTTGEPDVGTPDPEVLGPLLATLGDAPSREERIDKGVALARIIGTPDAFDEERARRRTAVFVDRAFDPAGTARQLVAVFASGSRADGLATLAVPTVVLHGDRDPLVDISGGRRTAELVPGARFVQLEGMGHDLPPSYWGRIVGGLLDGVRLTTT